MYLLSVFYVRSFLLVLLCLLIAAHSVFASPKEHSPWMKEYQTGSPLDLREKNQRGFDKVHFVDFFAARHGAALLPTPHPYVPGDKFLLEVSFFSRWDKVDVFLLNSKGETLDKPLPMPQHLKSLSMVSEALYFAGRFPRQPFYISARVRSDGNSSPQKFLYLKKITPRNDLVSYTFKLNLDPKSELMQQAMRGKNVSPEQKREFMVQGVCMGSQMLERMLNPQEQNGLEKMFDQIAENELDISKTLPITLPTFFVRTVLIGGKNPNLDCSLHVVQEKGTFSSREFVSNDPQWSTRECRGFQQVLAAFETRAQTGKTYAFLDSTCFNTGQDYRLKLQIATSSDPDFKFPAAKTATLEPPKPASAVSSANSIQLKKLCSIPGLLNPYYNTPIDLSLEQSGKAVVDTGGKWKAYLVRAPDCKISGRYLIPGFLNNTISRNGLHLYDQRIQSSENGPTGILGIEHPEGWVTPLTPPENTDRRAAEYPKISVDGSAVIWRTLINKKQRGYLIQDLKGRTLKELPLQFLEIYQVDMVQKTMIVYDHQAGLGLYDLEGKPLGTYLKIHGISLFQSHRPPIKWFKGKNGKRNWVAWNKADLGGPGESKPRVLWETDLGKGQYELGSGEALESVSVSGDGRFIAIAYTSRGSAMTQKKDFMISLLSTENGKPIYTQKLGNGKTVGSMPHAVAFLGDRFLVYNPMKVEKDYVQPQSAVLFEIQEKW